MLQESAYILITQIYRCTKFINDSKISIENNIEVSASYISEIIVEVFYCIVSSTNEIIPIRK